MAVTFPYVRAATWVDGSTTDTAAKRNTIEDGIFNAHQQPAVRVTHNASQSITNNTETSLAFNTERFDQAGGASSTQHDTVTNNSRLTCRYAGIYLVIAHVTWSAAVSAGTTYIRLRLNGTTNIAFAEHSGDDYRGMHVSTLQQMAVNDYVEARVFQSSGGAVSINSTTQETPEFMMCRVA